MSFRSIRHLATSLTLVALVSISLFAKEQPHINLTRGQLALGGYDAVAYWTDGKAVAGSSAFEYRWMDAVWRFVSADHRERFIKEPARYAPQFGGYCAYAVSQGHTADGDPRVWRIVDGKLYVNYSASVQKLWEQDVPGYITKAQQNWPSVLSK